MNKEYFKFYCYSTAIVWLMNSYRKGSLNPLDWGKVTLISFILASIVAYILFPIVLNELEKIFQK